MNLKQVGIQLVFLLFLGCCCNHSVKGNIENPITPVADTTPYVHSPHRATILSLIVPGAGQIYNRKYWKVPVVYAALGSTAYFFYDFNTKVQNQDNYFRDLYAQGKQPSIFEIEQRDNDRVNRDIAGISFVVAYVLQVIDATVDAHFYQFDINQKLSISLFDQPNTTLRMSFTLP